MASEEIKTIATALQKLLQISSPQEGLRLLQQHPELLTEQAELLLQGLIENAHQQQLPSFVQALTGLHVLIQEFRQHTTNP